MVISGLVLTLCDAADRLRECTERLRPDPRITLGTPVAARLPLVAEADDAGAAEGLVEELRALPGVVHVDVAFIEIDPAESRVREGSPFSRRRSASLAPSILSPRSESTHAHPHADG